MYIIFENVFAGQLENFRNTYKISYIYIEALKL